jgi:hypothetical protein
LSVRVDEPRDLELLDYLEPYVEWQSTLEPLANPPEGYLIPGVDVLAGLGQIRAKLSKSEYTTQAEFASDLAYLVSLLLFTPPGEGGRGRRRGLTR